MERYVTIENDFFEILIPDSIKEYGNEVIKYSSDKLEDFLHFFKVESYGAKIKCSFFTSREDFFKRIKNLAPEANPPSWAQGCFYGGETQILLNPQNIYDKFCTLAHESFHLLFKKFIYEKNNMNRIVWLDEALAVSFDGTTEKLIENDKFLKIILNLKNNQKLPKMNDLEFSKGNIKTEDYSGYDLFKVVGRYLIETKNKDELLKYVNNKSKIENDGYIILEDSIKYFSEKYDLNVDCPSKGYRISK